MTNITSLGKPAVFAGSPVLPTGYHYILQSEGVYQFGQFNGIYQIGIVNENDFSVVWGSPFYPSDGYPSASQMVVAECTNAYNNWNQYYLADTIAQQAITLIGF